MTGARTETGRSRLEKCGSCHPCGSKNSVLSKWAQACSPQPTTFNRTLRHLFSLHYLNFKDSALHAVKLLGSIPIQTPGPGLPVSAQNLFLLNNSANFSKLRAKHNKQTKKSPCRESSYIHQVSTSVIAITFMLWTSHTKEKSASINSTNCHYFAHWLMLLVWNSASHNAFDTGPVSCFTIFIFNLPLHRRVAGEGRRFFLFYMLLLFC